MRLPFTAPPASLSSPHSRWRAHRIEGLGKVTTGNAPAEEDALLLQAELARALLGEDDARGARTAAAASARGRGVVQRPLSAAGAAAT